MSSVSPVQLTGSQNTNSYKTSTEKSKKSPLKTGAAIGAVYGATASALPELVTKAGRENLKECSSVLGKGKTAAIFAATATAAAGIYALIGLGIGAIVKAVKKDGSTEQNTANTETKTIDKEA